MASDEELIEDLQAFADELGETPTMDEMDKNGPWHTDTYIRHFDSWNNALHTAGLDIHQDWGISREKLVDELRDFSLEIGEVPTSHQMSESGPRSAVTYFNNFESWNSALKAAGLETNKEIDIPSKRLIKDLRTFSEECDGAPTEKQMKEKGPWSNTVYKNRFGSWNKALRIADVGVNHDFCRPESSKELIKDLKAFGKEKGHPPTKREMDKNGPWAHSTYIYHFGSWSNALREGEFDIESRSGVGGRTYIDEYGEGWKNSRNKVLKRDSHHCRVCDEGGLLHVHHIKPRRKFDDVSNSNTLDNLITLCPSCHGTFEGMWQNSDPDEFEEKAKELYSQRA